jgi:hypothetical protein
LPTTDADTATDDYSYEALSLCFKEAREAKEFSGIGKKLTLQHAARRTQGVMPSAALADTLSFASSFSLADSFLANSAPQDLHMRASVNTAQAPFAMFLVEEDLEDTPSSLPTSPPTSEDTQTQRAARWTRCPAWQRPSRLGHEAPASPTFDIANTFLAAEEPKPINSSISPSSSAIEARMRVGSSVNIA